MFCLYSLNCSSLRLATSAVNDCNDCIRDSGRHEEDVKEDEWEEKKEFGGGEKEGEEGGEGGEQC